MWMYPYRLQWRGPQASARAPLHWSEWRMQQPEISLLGSPDPHSPHRWGSQRLLCHRRLGWEYSFRYIIYSYLLHSQTHSVMLRSGIWSGQPIALRTQTASLFHAYVLIFTAMAWGHYLTVELFFPHSNVLQGVMNDVSKSVCIISIQDARKR